MGCAEAEFLQGALLEEGHGIGRVYGLSWRSIGVSVDVHSYFSDGLARGGGACGVG